LLWSSARTFTCTFRNTSYRLFKGSDQQVNVLDRRSNCIWRTSYLDNKPEMKSLTNRHCLGTHTISVCTRWPIIDVWKCL